ncbi:MAG: ThiF family adenylyltransferase, partial [Myxococcota bacterium]
HSKMGLGRNKAAALQQAMQGLFGVKIDAVPHRLGEDNVEALLGGADLVLDCVDNLPTRQLIQRFVRAQEPPTPCLHAALAADGAYARLMWDPLFDGDAGDEGQATCEDGEHLPFIAFVAAKLASLVKDTLCFGRQRSVHLHPGGVVEVG